MRLKARLARLEADVRWLWTDGVANWAEGWLDYFEKKQQLEAHFARYPEKARVWRETGIGKVVRLPPEPAPPPRHPEKEESEIIAGGTPLQWRDHDQEKTHDSGRRLLRPCRAPPAMTAEQAPVVQPYDNGDPPEHMQIRPVWWRQRTAEDDRQDRDSRPYRVKTEYDPFADDG